MNVQIIIVIMLTLIIIPDNTVLYNKTNVSTRLADGTDQRSQTFGPVKHSLSSVCPCTHTVCCVPCAVPLIISNNDCTLLYHVQGHHRLSVVMYDFDTGGQVCDVFDKVPNVICDNCFECVLFFGLIRGFYLFPGG